MLVPLQGLALPAEVWERDVLPRRIGAYSPAWLDQLCAAGEVVWVGAGALGRRSGRVALYFRDDAAVLGPPPGARADAPSPPSARTTRSATRLAPGAVLLHRPARRRRGRPDRGAPGGAVGPRVGGRGDQRRVRAAALAAARRCAAVAQQARAERARRRRFGTRRARRAAADPGPLVADRAAVRARGDGDPAGRRRAQAELLLERYGIVTREHVLAEGIPGGFSSLYDSFAALETLGVCQRGYFVEGLGGAQFALPGRGRAAARAARRRRGARRSCSPRPIPAQPYGGVAELAASATARSPARQAGRATSCWPAPSRCSTSSAAARACRCSSTTTTRGSRAALEALAAAVARGRLRAPRDREGQRRAGGRLGLGGAAARARLPRRPAQADRRLTVTGVLAALATALALAGGPAAEDPAYLLARRFASACSRPAAGAHERRAQQRVARAFTDAGLTVTPRPVRGPRQGALAQRDRGAARAARLPVDRDGAQRHGAALARRGGQRVRDRHARRARPGAHRRHRPAATSGSSPPVPRSASTPGSPIISARARSSGHLDMRHRTSDLRWALALDEVGTSRTMWLRSPRDRRFERRVVTAASGTGLHVTWVADAAPATRTIGSSVSAGLTAAQLGVRDNPVRHTAQDVKRRLRAGVFPRVRRLVAKLVQAG